MGTKAAFEQKMDAELREWQARIDVLKAKADQAEASQRLKYHEEIEALRTHLAETREKLDALRATSKDAWEDVKGGAEQSWRDLRSAFERAAAKLK